MAQTEMDWLLSLSLLAKNWAEQKEQSDDRPAQFLASCRRSGRSPALPYPPYEFLESTMFCYQPSAKVTFLLSRTGDISTLH